MGENPRVPIGLAHRNAHRKWQTECLFYEAMSAPLDLFADDVIRTAYTRLLPLTLIVGVAAVLCRAILEKLVAIAVSAFRRKAVRRFIEHLAHVATRLRSETAAPQQVQPARTPPTTIDPLPGELPAPR
jgi:hypothetical protein